MRERAKPEQRLQESGQRWIETTADRAPVRLGLILNPHAGNSRSIADRLLLSRVIPEPQRIATTQNASDVAGALIRLVCQQGVNTLAVHGGDGTLHAVLNALWTVREELFREGAEQVRFPRLVLLHGGTMNMAARIFGFSGKLHRVLKQVDTEFGGNALPADRIHPLRVLRVRTESQTWRGLIFGSELVHNAIGLHRHFGDGYLGLVRLLTRAMTGAAFHTREWETLSPLLSAPSSPVKIDGVSYPRYGAVAATTVPLQLAKGWIEALDVAAPEAGFSTKLVLEQEPRKLVGLIPSLMANRSHERILTGHGNRELSVRGPFTLDGEQMPIGADEWCQVTLEHSTIPIFLPRGQE